MQEKYIPAAIMLIAGTATSIINIMNKIELIMGLKRLLLVLLIFYVIGLIAKAIIVKATTPKLKKVEEEVQDENIEVIIDEEKNKKM